jgi:PKD repeat protein
MPDIDFGVTKKTTFADTFEGLIIEQLKKQYGGTHPNDIELDFSYENISGAVVAFLPTVLDADTYDWNFGDGSEHSSEAEPSHDYEA